MNTLQVLHVVQTILGFQMSRYVLSLTFSYVWCNTYNFHFNRIATLPFVVWFASGLTSNCLNVVVEHTALQDVQGLLQARQLSYALLVHILARTSRMNGNQRQRKDGTFEKVFRGLSDTDDRNLYLGGSIGSFLVSMQIFVQNARMFHLLRTIRASIMGSHILSKTASIRPS